MVARNRDGSLLAAYTDRPHQVCVWRVADWSTAGCRRWHAPSDLAGRVAFSPDGRWLAASDPLQGRVSILDVARGLDEVGSLTLPGARGLIGASFSGAGRYLAVLDGNHRVHAVDLAELRERLTALGLSWPDAGH
jgi:WD40 repeat protein